MTATNPSYDYSIDNYGRVFVTYRADLTIDIINDFTSEISKASKGLKITGGLSDYTNCSSAELSIEELEAHLFHVKKKASGRPGTLPWALVAPDSFIFGLSRQWSSLAEVLDTPVNYHVCKTLEEGNDWLDAQALKHEQAPSLPDSEKPTTSFL